jgi:hypothetical protein
MSEYYKDAHRYDDIIQLPHHQSTKRAHMSLHDRAAQFSPFAALTGHEAAIEETERRTEEEITLDDTMVADISDKLYEISQHLSEKWRVSITYFRPDEKKAGGAYLTDVGIIKKINEAEQLVIMDSGMRIKMEQMIKIEVV